MQIAKITIKKQNIKKENMSKSQNPDWLVSSLAQNKL
jgi:hypothetical protein